MENNDLEFQNSLKQLKKANEDFNPFLGVVLGSVDPGPSGTLDDLRKVSIAKEKAEQEFYKQALKRDAQL